MLICSRRVWGHPEGESLASEEERGLSILRWRLSTRNVRIHGIAQGRARFRFDASPVDFFELQYGQVRTVTPE